ncbi:helix-turn-helix domain-containing protein, partial [Ligilactobacillus salivarius]|uniref:helix-turn-helix domain-containing protein n=1 Tax=Ligilactobacillus salivarius TaxID=1624 RepID=UPI002987FDF9
MYKANILYFCSLPCYTYKYIAYFSTCQLIYRLFFLIIFESVVNMTIYQRIKELASEKNISIRELEKQLNFSNGAINKWSSKAPSDKLEKVANYFNVSTDYLLGRSE